MQTGRAQVGKLWRDRYGDFAGWAHTILFAADLTKFKKLRNAALGEEDKESPPKKRASPAKQGSAKDGEGKGIKIAADGGEVEVPHLEY